MIKKYIVPLVLGAAFFVTGMAQVASASSAIVTFVPSLPDAQLGVAYMPTSLIVTGISLVSVTATNVPLGMSVSSGGVLAGTPTVAGTYLINLTATDITGAVGTGSVSLAVASTTATSSPCSHQQDHRGDRNNDHGPHFFGHR